MWYLTKLAMKNRVLTILLAAILTGTSIWGTLQLKWELIPDIEFPITTVLTIYPDASPNEVVDDVSIPIEQAIWQDWEERGLKELFSTSADGISIIFAEFEYGTSMTEVNKSIAETIAELQLPEVLQIVPQFMPQIDSNPRVIPLDISNMMPLVSVTLNGDKPPHELINIAETELLPTLQNVEGVYKVEIEAAEKNQLLVAPDPLIMNEHGISMSQIAVLLMGASNPESPAYNSVDEFNNISMMINDLTLRDVADVALGPPPNTIITRTNGQPCVAVSISKDRGANTVDVANAIAKEIDELSSTIEESHGDSIGLTTLFDQSEFVENSIVRLAQMALIGFALAAIVVFAFLMVFRASIITAMSIPFSILIGFLVMHLTNVTINLLTLSAMAIAVGRLIDNSIVVVEVVYRRLQEGESVIDATINGSKEVAGPITSSTLATVAIFIPVLFIGGMISEFFTPFALTITFALLASLFVALMVVPAFANFFVKKNGNRAQAKANNAKDNWYQKLYLSTLNWALAHRIITILIVFVLFIGSIGLSYITGTSFMPQMSEKMIFANVVMPSGAGLQATEDITKQIESLIDQNVSNKRYYFSNIGTSTSMEGAFSTVSGGGDNTATITIFLESEADLEKERSNLESAVTPLLEQIPGSFVKVSSEAPTGFADIDISIRGDDEYKLANITSLLHQRLASIEGVANLESQVTMVVPKLTIDDPSPEKLVDLGLSLEQQLQLQLEFQLLKRGGNIPLPSDGNTSSDAPTEGNFTNNNLSDLGGNITANDLVISIAEVDIDSEYYRIFLQEVATKAYLSGDAQNVASALMVGFPQFATLGDITNVQVMDSPTHISHIDLVPAARIQGAVTQEDVGSVNKLIQEEVDAFNEEYEEVLERDNIEIAIHGMAEEMAEMFSSMGIAILAAIVIAYLIVAISMRSILNPIIIMVSLPLASIGAVVALLVSGYTLGMSGSMGILMLVGIVLTNAIVLIDLVENLRKSGWDTHKALIYAGKTRLRPILMTALTTMIAMVPLALGVGEGGIIAAELAVVVIGGLFSSTLLTIIVIPVIYSLVDGARQRVAGAK